jgi:SAM-dependent methyltransferase
MKENLSRAWMRAAIAPLRQRRRRQRELEVARANNINVSEGHLGGYVRASRQTARSGLDVEHGDPRTYTPGLWRWAYEALGVRSVLDVGCGEGHAAAYFREMGCDVLAVDGSVEAKRDSLVPDVHVLHDFAQGPFKPEGQYDLVWCCEFVEHVEARYAPHFLEAFRTSRRHVMMTYAKPGQPGWHHVNCQPAEYWIDRLRDVRFRFDQALTAESRKNAEPGHYRNRGLLFVREDT